MQNNTPQLTATVDQTHDGWRVTIWQNGSMHNRRRFAAEAPARVWAAEQTSAASDAPIEYALTEQGIAAVEPFTDEERAEIADVTAALVAAIADADKLLARLAQTPHAAERQMPRQRTDDADARRAIRTDDADALAAIVQRAELDAAVIVAERGGSEIEQTTAWSRAVRIGTLTIGYVQTRGREAHIARNERMQQLEGAAFGDPQHGMFYSARHARRAVEIAFAAAVRTGTFNPKGA